MKQLLLFALLFIGFSSCGPSDSRMAVAPTSNRQPLYDFFNDIRIPIAEIEGQYAQLEGFTAQTKTFLESMKVQIRYRGAGMYFEHNKNREKGANEYANRFEKNGCQIHVIIYPATDREIFESGVGPNKSYGKETNNYYIYYQVFTAQPTSEELEIDLKNIIEKAIEKHKELL